MVSIQFFGMSYIPKVF